MEGRTTYGFCVHMRQSSTAPRCSALARHIAVGCSQLCIKHASAHCLLCLPSVGESVASTVPCSL
eukprot:11170319-Alexandrium_andersonii.AAC.1